MSTTQTDELMDLWPEVLEAIYEKYGDRLAKATVLYEVCQFIRKQYAVKGHRVDCTWEMRGYETGVHFLIIPLEGIHKVTLTGMVEG